LCADRFGGATTAVTGYTKNSFRGVANSVIKRPTSIETAAARTSDTLKKRQRILIPPCGGSNSSRPSQPFRRPAMLQRETGQEMPAFAFDGISRI
jgi:hypothetical protein